MGIYDDDSAGPVTLASQAAAIRKRQRNESQAFARSVEIKSDIGKAISDPCRIRVIYLLIERNELGFIEFFEMPGFSTTSPSLLSHHLDKLLRYQIVDRKADPKDGRNKLYSLTPRGRRIAALIDSFT